MNQRRRLRELVRRSRALLLAGGVVVVCLAVGQLHTVYAHDTHHHASPSVSPPQEAGKAASPERMAIPDVVLVNQHNEPVYFYRDLVKDKVVVINFIYTTCSTICLPMGANFSRLQTLLGGRMGQDVSLISVSLDPVTDTPQRLRAWGEKFHAGPGWTLLTGSKHHVDALLKALKVFTPDKEDHAPIILLGNDATGVYTRTYGLASPATLVDMLAGVSGSSTHAVSSQRGGQR